MCTVLLPPGGNQIAVKYIIYKNLFLAVGLGVEEQENDPQSIIINICDLFL